MRPQLPRPGRAAPVILVALLVAGAVLLAACGSGSASTAPTSAPSAAPPAATSGAPAESAPASPAASDAGAGAAGGTAVAIQGFAFTPATLTVPVGSEVTWTNGDGTGHTVTATDGSFDSGTIGGGGTFTQAFATAGTFAYHCTIHPSMTGTIVVQ